MKISKIKKLCKDRQCVMIYHDTRLGQWIGNGTAVYAAQDIPYVEEETVPGLFEIPDSKVESWCIQEQCLPRGLSFEDNRDNDFTVTTASYCIEDGRGLFRPVFTTDGPYMIQEEYMEPLDDEQNLTFAERKDAAGLMYILVKRGLFLRAIIRPAPVPGATADKLKALWTEFTRAKLRRNPIDLTEAEPEQMTMEGSTDENSKSE